jgi:hypothetical protein
MFAQIKPANTTTNSLFLAGNRFSTADGTVTRGGLLPDWVTNTSYGDPMALSAPFLYRHLGGLVHILSVYTVPMAYVLGGALALALVTRGIGVMTCCCCSREMTRHDSRGKSVNMHMRTANMHDFLISRGAAVSGVTLVVVLVPLYVRGARYYMFECSNDLVKTTSAYLADSTEITLAVAIILAAVTVSSIVFGARFRVAVSTWHVGRLKEIQQEMPQQQEEEGQQQQWHDGSKAVDEDNDDRDVGRSGGVVVDNDPDATNDADAVHPDQRTSVFKTVTMHRCYTALLFLLWVASLVLLSVPSVVYGMTTAVPTRDSVLSEILGKDLTDIVAFVHGAAPIIITLINSVIVPAVVTYCCERSTWQSAHLLLVSRLLTTWLVPVAVVVVFSNSCGRMWLRLWAKCQTEETMNELNVWGPSGGRIKVLDSLCYRDLSGTRKLFYQNGYINATVLVRGADICNPYAPAAAGRQQYAQCGRAVVEAMAPLLVGKMALATLLLPALTIFRWRVAPAGWFALARTLIGRCRYCSCRCRCRGGRRSGSEYGDDDGTSCSEEQGQDHGDGSSTGDHSGNETAPPPVKGLRLDNMVAQSLTWLDVAIVFGPHIPLLVPLVLISLATARWAHESVGLRCLGLQERRAEFSQPSTWYVLFSIVCQQALTVAVFAGIGDSDGGGGSFGGGSEGWMALVMVVVGALTTVVCVAVAGVPVRWLEGAGRWCGGCCVRLHRCCCCGNGGERRGRWAMGSTTELSNRSLLGDIDDERDGGHVGGVSSTMGSLQTPLLQG